MASNNGGLYALENVLDWRVVEAIGGSSKADDVISYYRIAAQNAGMKQISRHLLEIQKEVKGTGISDMMERKKQPGFIEPRNNFKYLMKNRLDEISYENKKFLKIMADRVVHSIEILKLGFLKVAFSGWEGEGKLK